MTDDVVIQVNNVSKKFKSQVVLKDITLQCRTGRIYGFVGYNSSRFFLPDSFPRNAGSSIIIPAFFIISNDFNIFFKDSHVLIQIISKGIVIIN